MENKLSQKDAIYKYALDALNGAVIPEGQKLKDLINKEIRKVMRQRLFLSFRSGEVNLRDGFDDSKLKKYCSLIISNWLKKDKRFN
jgi:hypothetical protein